MKLLDQLQYIPSGSMVEIRKSSLDDCLSIRVRVSRNIGSYIKRETPLFAECDVSRLFYDRNADILVIEVLWPN